MSETFRLECEARYWLRQTNRDPEAIKAMLARIAARRGPDAAATLRAEMLRQLPT